MSKLSETPEFHALVDILDPRKSTGAEAGDILFAFRQAVRREAAEEIRAKTDTVRNCELDMVWGLQEAADLIDPNTH